MRTMNSPVSVRFGAIVLIVMAGLILLAEGANTRRTDYLDMKPGTKPRENGTFRPKFLSTAIDFGKRSIRSPDSKKYGSMIFSLQKDLQHQKFPLFWLLQYLKNNPDLPKEVERELWSEYEDYRKASDNDDSYYLNK